MLWTKIPMETCKTSKSKLLHFEVRINQTNSALNFLFKINVYFSQNLKSECLTALASPLPAYGSYKFYWTGSGSGFWSFGRFWERLLCCLACRARGSVGQYPFPRGAIANSTGVHLSLSTLQPIAVILIRSVLRLQPGYFHWASISSKKPLPGRMSFPPTGRSIWPWHLHQREVLKA